MINFKIIDLDGGDILSINEIVGKEQPVLIIGVTQDKNERCIKLTVDDTERLINQLQEFVSKHK